METHMMTSNTSSAKSRTVALPQFTKNAMTGAKTPAKETVLLVGGVYWMRSRPEPKPIQ